MDLESLKSDIESLAKELKQLNEDVSKVILIVSLREVSESISSLSITIKDLCHNENTRSNLYYIWHRINDNKEKLLNTVDYFNSLILNKLTKGDTSDKDTLNNFGTMISKSIGDAIIILYNMERIKLKIDSIISFRF